MGPPCLKKKKINVSPIVKENTLTYQANDLTIKRRGLFLIWCGGELVYIMSKIKNFTIQIKKFQIEFWCP